MPALEFSRTHSYLPAGGGISLPVILSGGAERVKLLANVDTGASHCLFERRHAELLNLDVEAGDPMAFRTATGRVEAFGHQVTIETLGLNFESVVYFLPMNGSIRICSGASVGSIAFASAWSIMTGCFIWHITIKRRF